MRREHREGSYFTSFIWVSSFFFFFTRRLKGSPGQDGVKGGDNDVCPPTEENALQSTHAYRHIHKFLCACALNRRPIFFFFFLLARWASGAPTQGQRQLWPQSSLRGFTEQLDERMTAVVCQNMHIHKHGTDRKTRHKPGCFCKKCQHNENVWRWK